MGFINVLLLKSASNLGKEGDVITVSRGFARNFLFSKKIAILVNKKNKKYIFYLQQAKQMQEKKEIINSIKTAEKLNSINIIIEIEGVINNKFHGSITKNKIINKILEQNIYIDKDLLNFNTIKNLGNHLSKIKIHSNIGINLPISIISKL